MNTLRLSSSSGDIETAAALLKSGEAVAIPTETVYGLACILEDNAAKKVFAAKGRPGDNPFIVHVNSLEEAESVAVFTGDAVKLAKSFWPGALTMVLKKKETVPLSVTAGLATVAVRCPSHELTRAVIKAAKVPLAAPSANLSGKPSPVCASHVLDDLDGKIAAVVDGGTCGIGLESTVIDMTCRIPRLLRPGGVTVEMLREIIGTVEIDAAVTSDVKDLSAVRSPGMKYRHYAPSTPLVICENDSVRDIVLEPNWGILLPEGEENHFGCAAVYYTAENLYEVLRSLDTKGKEKYLVRLPAPEGIGLAVCNRLRKAAGSPSD